MEKFSNQNLKEVKDILKNGNTSITKNSNLTYDKLNIVTGSTEFRTLFLRSLISAIDSENKNEISILTNIQNIGKTQVKTTYIMEKDIDKVVMNICDDIFAVSRFSIHWNNRPNFIYVIDIPDNCYNKERYIEKLNKIINTASQLNVMIVLGIIAYSGRYEDFCNILSITNNQMGYSAINGDEFKVIDNKLYVDNAEGDAITFESYGYHKVVDDENRVIYEKDNYWIEISKKCYRYGKFYNDRENNGAYILGHEDRLIHELLNIFKRFRILDEDKEADKKKIRLTQETIDKTNKILDTIGEENIDKNKTYRIYVKKDTIGIDNKKCGENTVYVSELTPNKEILFNEQNNIPSKQRAFDWKTTIFIMNELIGKFNVVGKEEIK